MRREILFLAYLGVSKNSGTPKMDGLQGKTLLKWMIWGVLPPHPTPTVRCCFFQEFRWHSRLHTPLPNVKARNLSSQWCNSKVFAKINGKITLPETNSKSPYKWMVGIRSFPIGFRPIFRGEPLVSGRVYPTPFFLRFQTRFQPKCCNKMTGQVKRGILE